MEATAEWLATLCVSAGVVIGPVLAGGTSPWARLMLACIMTATSTLWLLSKPRPWRLVALPLAATALVGLQLLPLPDRLLMTLSPISGGAWKVALADGSGSWGTVSVDRGLTAAGARWLLLSLCTGCAVADLSRNPAMRRWITASVTASGIVIFLLLLVFPATGEAVLLGRWSLRGPLHWFRTPLKQPLETHAAGEWVAVEAGGQRYEVIEWGVGDVWGSYILSNHAACGLYLTMPVLASTWLALTRSRLPAWARGLVVVGIFAALFAMNFRIGSRAGSAAALIAALVFASLACRHAWARRTASVMAAACVVGVLGMALVLYGPFEHLESLAPEAWRPHVERILHDGRVFISKATFRIFSAAFLLGTGLSTFGELSARMIPGRPAFYYAHNDVGQLLAETGIVGGLVVTTWAVLACLRVRRFLSSATDTERCTAAGPLAALAALAAHSLFDWNMHIPANAFLALAVGGVAAGLMTVAPAPPTFAGTPQSPRSVALRIIATSAIAVAFALAVRDIRSEFAIRELRDAIAAARALETPLEATAPVRLQVEAAISNAEKVARWDGWNAEIHRQLAFAHVHLAENPSDGHAEAGRTAWRRVTRLRAAGRPGPEPIPPKR